MRALNWSLRLLGPLLLIGLLIKVDFREILPVLARMNVKYYAAGFVLTWLIVALRTWRWHEINRDLGIRLSFWYEFGLYHAAFALGVLTPARAGEFSKVYYLSHRGIPSSRAFGAILLDRMSDICWILLLGLPSLAMLVGGGGMAALWPGGDGTLLAAAVAAFVGASWLAWKWRSGRRGGREAGQGGNVGRAFTWLRVMQSGLRELRAGLLARVVLWTAVSWVIQYVQSYLFSNALGLNVGFWDLVVMINVVGIVSLLPITVAGLGSRDVTVVYYFAQLGLGAPEALAFSSLMLTAVLGYILVAAIVLLCWREGSLGIAAEERNPPAAGA